MTSESCFTKSRSSLSDESAIIRKTRTSQPLGICVAVSVSVMTNAEERKPLRQPRVRASRKLSEAGSIPAATSIVRDQRKNSGQRETTVTSASGGGGSLPCIDAGTERECNSRQLTPG